MSSRSPESKPSVTRQVNFSPDVWEAFNQIALRSGVSRTEALRRAISDAYYVVDQTSKGSKFFMRGPDNKLHEITFHSTERNPLPPEDSPEQH